jgi:hypothetical protein
LLRRQMPAWSFRRVGHDQSCLSAPTPTLQPKSDVSDFVRYWRGRTRVNPRSTASGGGSTPSAKIELRPAPRSDGTSIQSEPTASVGSPGWGTRPRRRPAP